MLIQRGKNADLHGYEVNQAINTINKSFSIPGKEICLWYVPKEFTQISDGGPEYGHLIAEPPTIFVATGNRTMAQIAGTIAQQYAFYLQKMLDLDRDEEEAVEFSLFVTGGNPYLPPARILGRMISRKIIKSGKC